MIGKAMKIFGIPGGHKNSEQIMGGYECFDQLTGGLENFSDALGGGGKATKFFSKSWKFPRDPTQTPWRYFMTTPKDILYKKIQNEKHYNEP